jgi:hypothetical protein
MMALPWNPNCPSLKMKVHLGHPAEFEGVLDGTIPNRGDMVSLRGKLSQNPLLVVAAVCEL